MCSTSQVQLREMYIFWSLNHDATVVARDLLNAGLITPAQFAEWTADLSLRTELLNRMVARMQAAQTGAVRDLARSIYHTFFLRDIPNALEACFEQALDALSNTLYRLRSDEGRIYLLHLVAVIQHVHQHALAAGQQLSTLEPKTHMDAIRERWQARLVRVSHSNIAAKTLTALTSNLEALHQEYTQGLLVIQDYHIGADIAQLSSRPPRTAHIEQLINRYEQAVELAFVHTLGDIWIN